MKPDISLTKEDNMSLSIRALEIMAKIQQGEDLPWAPKALGKLRRLGLAKKEADGWHLTPEGEKELRGELPASGVDLDSFSYGRDDPRTEAAIGELIQRTADRLHFDLSEINLIWEWSRRAVDTLGSARYYRNGIDLTYRPTGMIRLAWKTWPYADAEERRNTVVHEACHVLHFASVHRQGKPPVSKAEAHGFDWQALMIAAGEEPRQFHNIPTAALGLKLRHEALCSCSQYWVSSRKKKGIELELYECARCGDEVVISGRTNRDQPQNKLYP